MKNIVRLILALCLVTGVATAALAERADPRIRYVDYHVNDTTEVLAGLGVSTVIILKPGETISTMAVGDSLSWSIVPAANSVGIIFVKPKKRGALTNLNIITNMRVYTLILRASELNSVRAAFQVRFKYPDDKPDMTAQQVAEARKNISTPLLDQAQTMPDKVNHEYVYRGDDTLKPRVVFDDGTHTFMEILGEVPAVFIVEPGGKESLINFHVEKTFIVIDKVAAQFTLRAGDRHLCLYNTKFRATPPPDKAEILYGPKKVQ